jgi:hypothetical protein
MTQRPATRADLLRMAENTVRVGRHVDVGMTLAALLLREQAGDAEASALLDAALARLVVVPAADGKTGRLRERGLT